MKQTLMIPVFPATFERAEVMSPVFQRNDRSSAICLCMTIGVWFFTREWSRWLVKQSRFVTCTLVPDADRLIGTHHLAVSVKLQNFMR
jgi:hypothetical protein